MTTYNIELNGDILEINFGEPASNDQIIKDAAARLEEMAKAGILRGGQLLKINGPTSIPIAFVLAHRLCHLYGAIPSVSFANACFDPKLGKFVICVTHKPAYNLGDLID
jgi:CRISPR-associated protein Csx3